MSRAPAGPGSLTPLPSPPHNGFSPHSHNTVLSSLSQVATGGPSNESDSDSSSDAPGRQGRMAALDSDQDMMDDLAHAHHSPTSATRPSGAGPSRTRPPRGGAKQGRREGPGGGSSKLRRAPAGASSYGPNSAQGDLMGPGGERQDKILDKDSPWRLTFDPFLDQLGIRPSTSTRGGPSTSSTSPAAPSLPSALSGPPSPEATTNSTSTETPSINVEDAAFASATNEHSASVGEASAGAPATPPSNAPVAPGVAPPTPSASPAPA